MHLLLLWQNSWPKQLGRESFGLVSTSRVQPIVVKKGWWKEREAAVHIASMIRKRREKNGSVQPTSSFFFESDTLAYGVAAAAF